MICSGIMGCTNEPIEHNQLSFAIDDSFTPGERIIIMSAIDDWNNITLPSHHIRIDPNAEWHIIRHAPVGNAGLWEPDTKTIWIMPTPELNYWCFDNDGADAFRVVVRHELGHALGLQHTSNGIMAPGEECSHPVFAHEDINECNNVGAC